MDKRKKIKPIVFLTCFMLGITLFSIYSFAANYMTAGGDSTGKISQLSEQAENHELITDHTAVDSGGSNPQTALPAGDTDSDLYATSRGDEYRTPAAAPVKAAAKPASTPAKTPVKAAAKPAAAPKAAPAPAAKPAAPAAAPARPASGYEYNLDLLARLITAEAQGEPYEAQVGVGAVVMNRVKSGDWPNTIKGVIYQEIGGYYQFTPVVNGWIDKPAEPECIKAAKEAMSGADPTNGAQFYYDDKVTNQWILAKPVSVKFGHMVFAL